MPTTETTPKPTFKLTVPMEFPLERLADLLCNALEGGSDYWYVIKKYNAPPALDYRYDAAQVFRHIDYPMNAGGSLVFGTNEGAIERGGPTRWTLDFEAMERGLVLMAEKYPHHFANWLTEADDAETGDVFLQLALFGELVFG